MKTKKISNKAETESQRELFLKVLSFLISLIVGGGAVIGFLSPQFGGQSVNINNESGHTEINYNTFYGGFDASAVMDESIEADCSIRLVCYINNQMIMPNTETIIEPGDKIHIFAESSYGIERMGYFIDSQDGFIEIQDFFDNHLVITVPTGIPGSTHVLYVEAIAEDYYNVMSDYFRTGWIPFTLKYENWM